LKPVNEVKKMNTLSNSRVLAVIALVAGLILGMLVSWALWPVPTSLAPADLHPGYRDFYLSMVANEYSVNKDMAEARRKLGADKDRWASKDIAKALRELAKSPSADKAKLEALAAELDKGPAPTAQPSATTGGGTSNLWLIGCLGVILLALVVAGVYLILLPMLRERSGAKAPASAAVRSAQASKPVEATAWTGEAEKPLAQFVTTYEIGDDRYDTSFSIETPTGDFLGECGVGISETIGTGSPDKVTAFEVWLFDKNDIRTVTKVLMSEYSYGDQTLRAKLAPKGEPELARPEAAVELETATLRVRARVEAMEYGMGELPPRSFFSKLSLELAAWPKEVAPAPVA
jgi:hypothetical protein